MAKITSTQAKTKKTKKTKTTQPKKPISAEKKVAPKPAKSVATVASKEVKAGSKAATTKAPAKAYAPRASKLGLILRGGSEVGLRKLYTVSAFVFVVLAAFAGVFMGSAPFDLSLGFLAKDGLLSQTNTVFVPAQQILVTIDLRWVVVALMAISALFIVVRRRTATRSAIQQWHWLDAAISGAVIVETLAILVGFQELAALKLLGALTAIVFVFAWIARRENDGSKTFIKAAFGASIASGVLVTLTLLSYMIATPVYGLIRSPWYVYVLGATVLVSAILLLGNYLRALRKTTLWANPSFVERNYLIINLVAKVAFAAILILGIRA